MSEQHITRVWGTGVPIPGDDIDTDQILPARFLKKVTFDNMAEFLFYDVRRDDDGNFNDHPLNRFDGASIAVVNSNFACGASTASSASPSRRSSGTTASLSASRQSPPATRR